MTSGNKIWIWLTGLVLCCGTVWAATPVLSNVRASQRVGTKLVDIYYDVSDSSGHAQTVQVWISGDGGVTYRIPAVNLSGDVGSGVTVGADRHIVWNAGFDWNGQYVDAARVRIYANDGTTPITPLNMVYIPAGPFQMGDNLNEQGDEAKPVHAVNVDGFFMDKYEVSYDLWTDIRTWAIVNGYSMNAGTTRPTGHPIVALNWYDAVKWCNARSEKEGLTPVYYTSETKTQVYRTGNLNITNACVEWSASGYRLPTEAEWEKAARGSLMGNRYPWGDAIDGSMANYYLNGDPFDSASPYTTPCGYFNGSQVPAGTDMLNGFGLYDIVGNAWEWCWDWYSATYYGLLEANDNPKGPLSGTMRVMRGGSCRVGEGIDRARCASRDYRASPDGTSFSSNAGNGSGAIGYTYGFRCVRGL